MVFFEQKLEKNGVFISVSVLIYMVMKVIGMYLCRLFILCMFCLWCMVMMIELVFRNSSVLKKVWVIRWNMVVEQVDMFSVIVMQFSCDSVEYVMMCLMLFCMMLIRLVKKVVVVLMNSMKFSVVCDSLNSGDMWVIMKILVVIIVVVWISVEIGVGFFIELGSYMCSGIWVDLFMVLMNRQMQMIVVIDQIIGLFSSCMFRMVLFQICSWVCGLVSMLVCENICEQFRVLNIYSMLVIFSRKLKLLMWLIRNVFMLVKIVVGCLNQKLISRYDIRFIVFQLKNSCRKLLFIIRVSIEKVNSEMQLKNCWQFGLFCM